MGWSDGHKRVAKRLAKLKRGGLSRIAERWGVNPARISEVVPGGKAPTREMLIVFFERWRVPLRSWDVEAKR
jgi:hypothetical protein